MMVENFPKLMKTIRPQIQEISQTPSGIIMSPLSTPWPAAENQGGGAWSQPEQKSRAAWPARERPPAPMAFHDENPSEMKAETQTVQTDICGEKRSSADLQR